jgi:hypothetical protein
MSQAILISLLIATFAFPLSAAGHRSAVRGLRRAIIAMVITVFVYAIAIIIVLPRFT